jgi:HK97 family phage portal protein
MAIQTLGLSPPERKETRSNPGTEISPARWDFLFDHGSTFADINVNPISAMQSETVNGCVSLISSSIASLPLILYERNSNGSGKTEAFSNPIHSLLKHECNSESTPETLFTELVKDVLLYGQSFLEITRTGTRVTGLWYLHASNVRVYRNAQNDLQYDVTLGTNRRTLPATSICHIVGCPSGDGVTGISVLTTGREVIAENLAIQRHCNKYFANASTPSGILSTNGKIKPEDKSKMRSDWEALNLGSKQHKVAVLDQEVTYTPLNPSSNVETDLIKAKEWSRSAVAGLFHVNTQLLSSEARVSGEVYASQMLAFYELALKPIMKKIQSELLRKLFPGQLSRFIIEHRWMDLLKSDPVSMMESMSVIRSAGIYQTDELRELAGLNPLGGDVGSLVLAPVNFCNAEKLVNAEPNPKIAPVGNSGDNK